MHCHWPPPANVLCKLVIDAQSRPRNALAAPLVHDQHRSLTEHREATRQLLASNKSLVFVSPSWLPSITWDQGLLVGQLANGGITQMLHYRIDWTSRPT